MTESKTETQFKSSSTTTTSVTYLLNNAIGENKFKIDSEKNNGFPILYWE
jgi:uncharacterized protein with HEPN domain